MRDWGLDNLEIVPQQATRVPVEGQAGCTAIQVDPLIAIQRRCDNLTADGDGAHLVGGDGRLAPRIEFVEEQSNAL